MSRSSSPFCWIDLKTNDINHTKDFYEEFLGWTYKVEKIFNREHILFYADGARIGGISDLSAPIYPPGIKSHLSVYIQVADAARAAEKSVEAGGKVLIDPFELEGFGVLTVIEDAEGAVFSAWEARGFRGFEFSEELEGAPVWFQLRTADIERATSFYSHVFNWEINNKQTIVHNKIEIGEFQRLDPKGEKPYWEVGFMLNNSTDKLDKALSRGARILRNDTGRDRHKIIKIADPYGIVFSIIEKSS